MCSTWLLEVISAKKIFTLICSALTFFLFCNLLFTFAVSKPTSTYKQEKELETFDLPEIVVCPDPGFKLDVLEKYGYSSGDFYFVGYIKKGVQKLYGWNGDVGVENSSRDILEESLVINTPLIGKAKLWQSVGYLYTGWINSTYPTISRRTLVYPHGCCISFSPSAPTKKTHTVQNVFYIKFNRTSLINTNITKINVFLMDKTSSIRLYPDGSEMIGDPVTLDLTSPKVLGYKTYISRSQNIEGDPSLDCADYTHDNSYYDCIQNELKETFNQMIGCLPPTLFPEPNTMCNRKFNSSSRGIEAKLLLRSLYGHDYKFKCKRPCQTNKYSTRLYDKSNLPTRIPLTTLSIIFDKTVKVVHTKFSMDTETILTGFGGSVSSGRTLLWILVSLLGASKVRFPFIQFY